MVTYNLPPQLETLGDLPTSPLRNSDSKTAFRQVEICFGGPLLADGTPSERDPEWPLRVGIEGRAHCIDRTREATSGWPSLPHKRTPRSIGRRR
jgi:hypothetical protein